MDYTTNEKAAEVNPLSASEAKGDSLPLVLMVDDQPARLLTYEAVLQGVGVTCVRALSGEEALARLLKQSFSLILLDVSMPGMDGFETARAIREHPRYERTPIIFVTGVHISELDTLRGYEVGAIDYIAVPVVPEILRSKVALLVELSKRRKQLDELTHTLHAAQHDVELAHTFSANGLPHVLMQDPLACTSVLAAVRDDAAAITDWKYVDINDNALALTKKTRDSVIGLPIAEVLGPDEGAQVVAQCTSALSANRPRHYLSQQSPQRYAMSIYPAGPDHVVVTGIDLTALSAYPQKPETDEPRLQERAWLATLLDSLNEEVYFTDPQRRYTYANPAALRAFGYASVQGSSVEELASKLEVLRADGTPRPIEESPALRSLKGETIRLEEQLIRHPVNGHLSARQVSAAPVRDAAGHIVGAVSVVRDVTAQRQVDAAVRLRELRARALLRLADLSRTVTSPADLAHISAQILGETLNVSRCGYGTIDAVAETITVERDWNAEGIKSIRSAAVSRLWHVH